MSRQEEEESDSDDDREAYRIQQAMAATDMKALDSVGQFSFISSFHFYLISPVLVDILKKYIPLFIPPFDLTRGIRYGACKVYPITTII